MLIFSAAFPAANGPTGPAAPSRMTNTTTPAIQRERARREATPGSSVASDEMSSYERSASLIDAGVGVGSDAGIRWTFTRSGTATGRGIVGGSVWESSGAVTLSGSTPKSGETGRGSALTRGTTTPGRASGSTIERMVPSKPRPQIQAASAPGEGEIPAPPRWPIRTFPLPASLEYRPQHPAAAASTDRMPRLDRRHARRGPSGRRPLPVS